MTVISWPPFTVSYLLPYGVMCHRGIRQAGTELTDLLFNLRSFIWGGAGDDARVAEGCPKEGGHHKQEEQYGDHRQRRAQVHRQIRTTAEEKWKTQLGCTQHYTSVQQDLQLPNPIHSTAYVIQTLWEISFHTSGDDAGLKQLLPGRPNVTSAWLSFLWVMAAGGTNMSCLVKWRWMRRGFKEIWWTVLDRYDWIIRPRWTQMAIWGECIRRQTRLEQHWRIQSLMCWDSWQGRTTFPSVMDGEKL